MPMPEFNSQLSELVFELEHERNRNIRGSTPPWLFFDLKEIMHRLESLTSARIEGNRTTLLTVVERVIEDAKSTDDEGLQELANIEKALDFVEDNVPGRPIDNGFICELHKMTTEGLSREGSKTPGQYRTANVTILNSRHTPPDYTQVQPLMQELIEFVSQELPAQKHLLHVAIAHHRMAAIHPFDNGNGRTVRLLTYAMLVKYGFIDTKGFRLLNPSAIFCMDRERYYNMLELADTGVEKNLLEWCSFVLAGIASEVSKVNKLLDRKFAEQNIIHPSIDLALSKKQISEQEYAVMRIGMQKNIFAAKDVKHLFPKGPSQAVRTSQLLAKMRKQRLIMVHPDHKTKYVIRFSNNYLLRGVIQQMAEHELLPLAIDEP